MNTLNLLPSEQKKSWHQRQLLEGWQRSLWVMLVAVVLMNGAAVAGSQWLLRRDQTLQADILRQQSSASGSTGSITNTIQQINTTLDPLSTALGTPRAWSSDLAKLLAAFPTKAITLSEMSLTATGQFDVSGTAAARADFLQLDALIKASPLLKNVTTDTRADRRENLPFHYQATFQPS